jgi:hypothetical protein
LAQDRKDLGFAVSRHLHLNFLMHLVEKILRTQPLSFGEDYPPTSLISLPPNQDAQPKLVSPVTKLFNSPALNSQENDP